MFEHFKRFPWVLTTYRYRDIEDLKSNLEKRVESGSFLPQDLRFGKWDIGWAYLFGQPFREKKPKTGHMPVHDRMSAGRTGILIGPGLKISRNEERSFSNGFPLFL